MRSRDALLFRLFSAALMVALLLAASMVSAQSEKKAKPQTRRVQALREWAYKRLNAAHEALAQGNHAEALAELDELKGNTRLNDHEKALVWQTYGYVYGTQEKYKEATEAFEKCLATNALPEGAQLNVQYNVAQLYVLLERFPEAVTVFREWLAKTEDPSPEAHYIYAIALFQSGDKDLALEQGLAAVQKAKIPKESWLQLVLSLYFEKKQYEEASAVLETLLGLYPKKAYWTQLPAVYSETGDFLKALAVMALAYEQDLLTDERELTHLAHLYLHNSVPYQAAQVLQKGMDDGRIQETAESWQLLADAWVSARERGKAREPLEQAASRAGNGEPYLRLAQLQIEHEEWSAARKSLTRALEKGELSDPGNAQLLLGIASASDAAWQQAQKAFQAAAGYEKTAKAAQEWLLDVEAELAAQQASAPVEQPSDEAPAADAPAASPRSSRPKAVGRATGDRGEEQDSTARRP